jgi:hypothetical protein
MKDHVVDAETPPGILGIGRAAGLPTAFLLAGGRKPL